MRRQRFFGMILVVTLLVMPSGVVAAPSVAVAGGQGLRSSTGSVASQLSGFEADAATGGGVCSEGPAVYVACDPADISDDIQAAVNYLRPLGGGTIYLPECDAQFKTTVGSTYANVMPGGINVIGQGVGKTILRSDGSSFFDINHWGQFSEGFRISGISFYGVPASSGTYTGGGINITNVVDFRIDNCYFERILYNIGVRSGAGYPQSRGVIDHCSFVAADMTAAYGVYDSRVWDADMKLGTAEATFIEDCYMEGMGHPGASFGGGHYVLRYNEIVDSSSIDAHGPGFDSSGRGARATEIYGNYIYHNPGVYGWTAVGLRAGGGVIFGNTFQNYDHYARFSIDTQGYNATGGVYPTLDQVHDMWLWDNTLIDIANDPNDPDYEDDWDQYPNRVTVSGILLYSNEAGRLIQKDRDFHVREPNMTQDGFVYEPYTYPHPLTKELNLKGIPANQAIHLNWEVCASLPVTGTWRIDYEGTPGDEPSPITGIVSPTRTYTLTGMTNFEMYTVTLSAMVDSTVIMSDTVCVMPTNIFVYLPIVRSDY